MARANHNDWAGPLLAWYGRARKPLPWRLDPAPYRVWIGEVMSQQTALAVVVPRFEELVAELPDVEALATCPERKLGRLWAGLGYYARARNLREGARRIVEDMGGRFPTGYGGWLGVPGCGPCTAAMVSSMCFGERVVAVDGNVVRVASRLSAMTRDVWTAGGQARIRTYLEERIPRTRPGDFNQALMELGQEICTRKRTGCTSCPIRRSCLGHERSMVDMCPPPRPRPRPVERRIAIVVLHHLPSGDTLLGTRGDGFLARTVGFPILCSRRKALESVSPLRGARRRVLPRGIRHTITRHRITARIVAVDLRGRKPSARRLSTMLGVADPQWVPLDEARSMLSSSLDRKALGSLPSHLTP